MKLTETQLARFMAKVAKSEPGCWLWRGAITSEGYGAISIDGRTKSAHRVSYELYVGPIPEGLTIDHVKARGCKSRACCNPDHLEAVTIAENLRRGNSPSWIVRRENRCKRGHDLSGDVYVYANGRRRICRACARINDAKRRHTQRQLERAA